jgi:hypothetical protein
MKIRRKILFLAIALVISIITLITGISNIFGSNDNTPGIPNQSPNLSIQSKQMSPTLLEATIYAQHYAVTTDEALNRFKLGRSFPGLENELSNKESATFGGLWIQNEPEFKLVIAFTHNGKETLSKYIGPDIPSYVDIRTVNKSYSELNDILSAFRSEIIDSYIQAISMVDIMQNRVEFDILNTEKSNLNNAIKNNTIAIPDNVYISYIDSFPQLNTSTVYGGLMMDGGTTGFSVKNAAGTRGIITAGHIDQPQGIIDVEGQRVDATLQNRSFGGYYDTGFWTCPAGTTINYNCAYYRLGYNNYLVAPVTGTSGVSSQRVGQTVSKQGMATGYTSGQITNLECGIYVLYQGSYYYLLLVQVNNCFNYNRIAQEGDSGCPWFNGDGGTGLLALGTHSSATNLGVTPQYAYYMPINYINTLGVTVLTPTDP